jgi:hypothetical protein
LNFIDGLLDYTRKYESPTSFWKWSAYATIAAVLRDNCKIQQGDDGLYPNIYVLLLADSAIQRKDKPVRLCQRLVESVRNTKVIAGRTSIQAILDELARGESDPNTGIILKGGSALFSAPELAAGLVADPQAVSVLTDIYAYYETYVSRLRGQGTFKIHKLCFTAIMASNKDLLIDVYDQRAMGGGLLGRTFLVTPDEWRPANSLFEVNHRETKIENLVEELRRIASLKGDFSFTREAMEFYNQWYIPFRESYKQRPDRSGIAGRIHTGVLKVSMLCCANSSNELVIQEQHVQEAIRDCMGLMSNYTQLTLGGGKSTNSEIGAIVLNEIYAAPEHLISRQKLVQKHWNAFDLETLDKLINTLSQGGMVDLVMVADGVGYKLTKKCLEVLFRKEENAEK